MATINLFGASGHAKVIMDIIRAQGDEVGKVYDDNPHISEIGGKRVDAPVHGIKVEGPMIISIGSGYARQKVSERYNVAYAQAISPTANISPTAEIGAGTVVMPYVVINADAIIGRHCIINTKASIDHECRIGDFVHIAPGCTLSGDVTVGDSSWIGVGSCVKQGISIGKNCLIGAGSVVVKDIPDDTVAYGNPCRVVRKNVLNIEKKSI